MLHTDNMEEVPDSGELVEKGPYLVRISKVEEKQSNAGNPMVVLGLKIQTEGKSFGREVFTNCSLQPHALFSLKKFYSAVGYKPGAEGHDPEQILDGELYVYIDHRDYETAEGKKGTGHDFPLWGIKSLADGPAQPRS